MQPDVIPSPETIGLTGFPEWRKGQCKSILALLDSGKRFKVMPAPTGSGKSLMYVAAAILKGKRTLILTSTKALQTQLMRDFAVSVGLADVRGRVSYLCPVFGIPSDRVPCRFKLPCNYKQTPQCTYYRAVLRAAKAEIVTTNYAYWMTVAKMGRNNPLGEFDFLVCDEAHDIPALLNDFLSVRVPRRMVTVPSGGFETADAWAQWALQTRDELGEVLEALVQRLSAHGKDADWSKAYRVATLYERMAAIQEITPSNMFVEMDDKHVSFTPIWPRGFGERYLFKDIPDILLSSASICAKTLDMVGIDAMGIETVDLSEAFPRERRMLIHIPTARINHRTPPGDYKMWVRRIDQIIARRLDRKGIIHTISYARRDRLMKESEYAGIFVTHETGSVIETVAKFKRMDPPAVLVSPSVSTGVDFPYDECRYQIIGKVPYPDTTDKITALRMQKDKEYASYLAAQELVQTVGRGTRAVDDFCESFIVDDNIRWFITRSKDMLPLWFRGAYTSTLTVPDAPTLDSS